jgi:hypothetical protein
MPLVDDYLDFLAGRCRPNTVLAAVYDLVTSSRVVYGRPGRAWRRRYERPEAILRERRRRCRVALHLSVS